MTDPVPPAARKRNPVKSAAMFALGLLAAVYLANPGLGFFELLPDNIPGLGNLDEGVAVILLLRVLSYFGIDLTRSRSRKQDRVVDV